MAYRIRVESLNTDTDPTHNYHACQIGNGVPIRCKVSCSKFELYWSVLSQWLSWVLPSYGNISISPVIHGHWRNALPSQWHHMSFMVSQITNKSNIIGQAKKSLLALCKGNPVTEKAIKVESVSCHDISMAVSEETYSVNYIIITAACRFNFYSMNHYYLKLFSI